MMRIIAILVIFFAPECVAFNLSDRLSTAATKLQSDSYGFTVVLRHDGGIVSVSRGKVQRVRNGIRLAGQLEHDGQFIIEYRSSGDEHKTIAGCVFEYSSGWRKATKDDELMLLGWKDMVSHLFDFPEADHKIEQESRGKHWHLGESAIGYRFHDIEMPDHPFNNSAIVSKRGVLLYKSSAYKNLSGELVEWEHSFTQLRGERIEAPTFCKQADADTGK